MYLIYHESVKPIAIFLHMPRTGGTFVRQAMNEYGFELKMLCRAHTIPSRIPSQMFSFVFVRHPVDWYASLFAYRQEHGWPGRDSYPWSARFQAETLEGFVENVQREYPSGYLKFLADRAVQGRHRRVDYVGRAETLTIDLSEIVRRISGKRIFKELHSMERVNSSKLEYRAVVGESLANGIREYEHAYAKDWGYL